MQINFLSQKNSIIGGVVIFLIIGIVFYFYNPFSQTSSPESVLDTSILDKKISNFLSTKNKIDFSDSSFLKSVYYTQLEDYSEEIPMTSKRGRSNPFVPYVAP